MIMIPAFFLVQCYYGKGATIQEVCGARRGYLRCCRAWLMIGERIWRSGLGAGWGGGGGAELGRVLVCGGWDAGGDGR